MIMIKLKQVVVIKKTMKQVRIVMIKIIIIVIVMIIIVMNVLKEMIVIMKE